MEGSWAISRSGPPARSAYQRRNSASFSGFATSKPVPITPAVRSCWRCAVRILAPDDLGLLTQQRFELGTTE